MRGKRFWLMSVGLVELVAAVPLSAGWAGEAEKKAPAPATEGKKAEPPKETKGAPAKPEKPAAAEKLAGLVGTIVAFAPASRTLVVDVPLGKDVLRIGARVTNKTKIEAAGAAATIESLKAGARVRINFRRVADGDEAISVELLGAKKG